MFSYLKKGDEIRLSPLDYFSENKFDYSISGIIDFASNFRAVIIFYTLFSIAIGLCTKICHWGILEWLFGLMTNWIILIAQFGLLIAALEIKVKFVKLYDDSDYGQGEYYNHKYYYHDYFRPKHRFTYKFSLSCSFVLIIISIISFFFIRRYSNDYHYGCTEVLVEPGKRIYHLDSDCEDLHYPYNNIQEFKAEKDGCILCDKCKEWAEDSERDFAIDGTRYQYYNNK
jgi:hypothetical protein